MAMAAARVGSGEEKVAAARGLEWGGAWVADGGSRLRHLRQSIAGVPLVARDQMAQRGLPKQGSKLPCLVESTREDLGRGVALGEEADAAPPW